MLMGRLSAFFCVALVACAASGATFYVDPVNGSASGDGSQANPWLTIEQVIDDHLIESYLADGSVKNSGAPVKGGDTIRLLDGYHSDIYLTNYYNAVPITIEAEPGCTPRLFRLYVNNVTNWVFRGLDISPSNAPSYAGNTCVSISTSSDTNEAARSRNVTVEDCYLYSVEDSSGWTIDDWKNTAVSGVGLHRYSREVTIRDCYIKNVRFGISAGAHDCLIEGTTIENFSADGIRATGPGNTYLNNLIMNAYVSMADGDANHDDGIQGYLDYHPGQEIANVVIRGNTIINRMDPNQPFQNGLQGIGCFDGPFVNWVVENNLVVTNSWHGISIYTSWDCVIANNTSVNPYGTMTAWIQYENAAINAVVRNNITERVDVSEAGVVVENNLNPSLYDWDDLFVDWENYDYRLKAGSAAIDYGRTMIYVSPFDKDGNPRPMGLGVDAGAYEFESIYADASDDIVVDDLLGDNTETVTLDASGSLSGAGAVITQYRWEQDGTILGFGETLDVDLSAGEHVIDLTVYDDLGRTSVDSVTVTVNPILHAAAGDDQVVYDSNGDGFESVTLDGSASSSSLGNVTFYVWYEDGAMVGAGAVKTIDASVGTHVYTLQVRDSLSNVATDEVEITVSADSPLTPGDANGDGFVNLDDFIILKQNYGTTGAAWAQGDFNDDGAVNLDDFILLKQNYGS